MSDTHSPTSDERPLHGIMLIVAALVLSLSNFIAVLDMTIANVSVSTIAGNLGITTSQGTWIITSYSVAEAITVPLTGWLAGRFGAVRVFVTSVVLFGLCSALCGISGSLGVLVTARVLQGLAGGPLIPLSQTLLLKIFPREKAAAGNALWAMTTLVAPVLGPIVGGVICDSVHWSWIFFINVPIALVCAWYAWRLLKRYETPIERKPIDTVGLGLLVLWVGALQLILDEGKDLDWFASTTIVMLAIAAVIGFAAFMIWEMTEKHPIVDLRVFRHRGYSMSVITLVLAFGSFFSITVLTPLWLQQFMGYTATWSGLVSAWMGVFAVLCAPLAGFLIGRIDSRALICFGVGWIATISFLRGLSTTDMTYWQISIPLLLMGIGLPLFFVPLSTQALGAVEPDETASAAGLMNFLRTLAGAFGTSLTTTAWENGIKFNHAELVSVIDPTNQADLFRRLGTGTLAQAGADGFSSSLLDRLIEGQAVMLATNQLLMTISAIMLIAAASIWLAPRTTRAVDTSAVH